MILIIHRWWKSLQENSVPIPDLFKSTQWELICTLVWWNTCTNCYRLSACIPSAILLNPNPQCDGVRRGASGRWPGHEGAAPRTRISVLTKEAQESALTPSTVWGHNEKTVVCNLEGGLQQNLDHAGTLTLDIQPPEPWETHFRCL